MKKCIGCHIIKPLESYSRSRGTKAGRLGRCKQCWAVRHRELLAIQVNNGRFGYCESCSKPLSRSPKGRKLPLCKNCVKGKLSPHYKGGHVSREGYRVVKSKNRNIFEHRLVMEKHLGRKLYPDENVHHLNGDRLDNRIENLELWSFKQPYGQRAVDKLTYAKEIIKRYELLQEIQRI